MHVLVFGFCLLMFVLCVKKMERERMEKMKLKAEKEKAEKEKGEKVWVFWGGFLFIDLFVNLIALHCFLVLILMVCELTCSQRKQNRNIV